MTLAAASFDHIRRVVRERSAIVLDDGKEYLVEARLTPIAKSHGLNNLDELSSRLTASSPGLIEEVVEAMTTNETSFYRDAYPFEALRAQVLPELLKRRGATKRLGIWCAACSSGQEPYTIAIIIREHFPELASWELEFYGTDLSLGMLERAKAGRYRQLEVNRGLPVGQLVKYFERSGLDWHIRPEIKQMIRFQQLNLVAPWHGLPRFDLVFLRNVLIYFDVEVKKDILGKVRRHLAPDGYLFLGGAETTMNIDDAYERMPYEHAGCYRLAAARSL
jgi:chemotaxis protein methyltransferase CheR